MNFSSTLIIAIILLLSNCIPQQVLSQSKDVNSDEQLLKKMEYNWLVAEFKLDTVTISKMMDPSFISINPAGISNKQEELDGIYKNISQRIKEEHTVDSIYLDDFTIKFYGTTAIVSFVAVTKGTIKTVPFANRRTRFYDVWIKRKGKWLAVSSQGTPLH